MKRVLSLLLSVLMLTSVMAAVDLSAYAATVDSGTCGDNLTWVLDDEGTLTISDEGKMSLYNFKNELYAPWFNNLNSISKIVILDGVTSIGDYAFYGCESVTSVSIPSSVTGLGDWAFAWCENLTSITIPVGVIYVSDYVFYGCTSLIDVTISDSVTSLGAWAFGYCTSLTSITIPNSVTHLGKYVFEESLHLTDVYYDGPESDWNEIDMEMRNYDWASSVTIHFSDGTTSTGSHMHTWNNGVVTLEPTCTSSGEKTYTCTICGALKTEILSMLDHNFYSTVTREATCTAEGIITYTCSECGITTVQYTAALGHTWDDGVVTVEPTYDHGGTTTYTCKTCGETYSVDNIEALPSINDNSSSTESNDSSSKVCTTHMWDIEKVTTAATCTSTGVKTYTCKVCGATKTEIIPMVDHTYSITTKAATCDTSGTKTYTCTVCGATKT